MVNPEMEVVMPEKEEYPVSKNYFIVTGEWTQCCLRSTESNYGVWSLLVFDLSLKISYPSIIDILYVSIYRIYITYIRITPIWKMAKNLNSAFFW